MTTAIDVAGYIRAQLNLPGYDTKKLQKLVYFSQVWALAWTGKTIFNEPFEAWPDGPVVRTLYRAQRYEVVPPVASDELPPEAVAIINSVLNHYSDCSYQELVDLTHEHLPWSEARGELPVDAPSRIRLHKETMRRFYIEQDRDGNGPARIAVKESASEDEVRQALSSGLVRWAEALNKLA